jgi:hypothetical protein
MRHELNRSGISRLNSEVVIIWRLKIWILWIENDLSTWVIHQTRFKIHFTFSPKPFWQIALNYL